MHFLMFFTGWSIFVIIPLSYINTYQRSRWVAASSPEGGPAIQRWAPYIIFDHFSCIVLSLYLVC